MAATTFVEDICAYSELQKGTCLPCCWAAKGNMSAMLFFNFFGLGKRMVYVVRFCPSSGSAREVIGVSRDASVTLWAFKFCVMAQFITVDFDQISKPS